MVVSLVRSIPLIVLLLSLDFASKRFFFSSGNAILNSGISFGLFPGNNALMIIIALVAVGIFCAMLAASRTHMNLYGTSLVFMISGALGNLIDRIQIGAVIDFIRIGSFPVFNFADAYLTIGVILMFLYTFWPSRDKHKHAIHKRHIKTHKIKMHNAHNKLHHNKKQKH